MREILFRGKDIYGKWFYGDLINLTKEIKEICNHTQLEHAHSVNPDTVGQCTGLVDKNGTKIFEGDIVKIFLKDGVEIGPIKWSDIGCRYKFASPDGTAYAIDVTDVFEVIGNIHDNPELLKECVSNV